LLLPAELFSSATGSVWEVAARGGKAVQQFKIHAQDSALESSLVPRYPLKRCEHVRVAVVVDNIRYDTIEEINVDSKAEYTA